MAMLPAFPKQISDVIKVTIDKLKADLNKFCVFFSITSNSKVLLVVVLKDYLSKMLLRHSNAERECCSTSCGALTSQQIILP